MVDSKTNQQPKNKKYNVMEGQIDSERINDHDAQQNKTQKNKKYRFYSYLFVGIFFIYLDHGLPGKKQVHYDFVLDKK